MKKIQIIILNEKISKFKKQNMRNEEVDSSNVEKKNNNSKQANDNNKSQSAIENLSFQVFFF